MGDKDFFLSPDDAQTLGDINYMRKSKRVRRTFPKTLKNKDGFEITVDVSSMEDRSKLYNGNGSGNPSTTVFTTPTPTFESEPTFSETYVDTEPQSNGNGSKPVEQSQSVQKRRQQDDGMDMFRKMAKNIGKR